MGPIQKSSNYSSVSVVKVSSFHMGLETIRMMMKNLSSGLKFCFEILTYMHCCFYSFLITAKRKGKRFPQFSLFITF